MTILGFAWLFSKLGQTTLQTDCCLDVFLGLDNESELNLFAKLLSACMSAVLAFLSVLVRIFMNQFQYMAFIIIQHLQY